MHLSKIIRKFSLYFFIMKQYAIWSTDTAKAFFQVGLEEKNRNRTEFVSLKNNKAQELKTVFQTVQGANMLNSDKTNEL